MQVIASRRIFLANAGGASPHRLTGALGGTDEWPTWTAGGRWVIFVRWRQHTAANAADATLWAVRPDGTGAQRLTSIDLPPFFENGFGFYGTFAWDDVFDMSPA